MQRFSSFQVHFGRNSISWGYGICSSNSCGYCLPRRKIRDIARFVFNYVSLCFLIYDDENLKHLVRYNNLNLESPQG